MLRSIQSLKNFTMMATDGEIGKVKDFYFDDQTWTLRYLVVETGNWLFGRKVLISTTALHAPDWDSHSFPVNLTKEQIKHSPDIDTEKPVSRQQEASLHSHYLWPVEGGLGFMTTGMVGGVVPPEVAFDDQIAQEMHKEDTVQAKENHLRSFKHLRGYQLRNADDEIGEVEDFLIDENNWTLPYVVVDTGNWYAGKMILIPSRYIDRIEWESTSIISLQSVHSLKNSPEFDYTKPLNEEYLRSFDRGNMY